MTARTDPNELPCADCGHVWFPGERRHERDESGAVLCLLCRRRRGLAAPPQPRPAPDR